MLLIYDKRKKPNGSFSHFPEKLCDHQTSIITLCVKQKSFVSYHEKNTHIVKSHVVRFQSKPPVVQKTVDHRRLTDRGTGGKNDLPGSLVKLFEIAFY